MGKLIDKKGRIFGIINIIDLFIILAVVFVGGYFALKYIRPNDIIATNQENIMLTLYCELAPNFAIENLEKDGKVEDDTKNIDLGRVVDFTVFEGIISTQDAEGNQVMATSENYSSLEIKSLAKGQIIENGGIKISGNTYNIGHTMAVRAGKSKFHLRLAGFEAVQ